MSRIHIGIGVADIGRSTRFYSDLFGAEPTVRRADYSKWLLDDPKVNFSISSFGDSCQAGDVHFGLQVEDRQELDTVAERLTSAGEDVLPEEGAVCCYHRADKAWVLDPENFRWETFLTHGTTTVYGEDNPSSSGAARRTPAAVRASHRIAVASSTVGSSNYPLIVGSRSGKLTRGRPGIH